MSNPFVSKTPIEQARTNQSYDVQTYKNFYEQTYKSFDQSHQSFDAQRAQRFDAQQCSLELTRNLFYEEAYRLFSKIEKTQPYPVRNSYNSDGRVFELSRLDNNTGRHRTADAVVFVSNVFDPKKPIKLVVYNHGLETNASDAFKNSLAKQMSGADGNTVLIVPEWQTKPDSRINPNDAKFHEPQFFRKMLTEIMSKTPPLRNLTINNISSIGIITHSGGYKAAMSEMYKNGLYDKVNSLTVLDSMYNPFAFDRWMQDNITDLAYGRKQLQVIYTDHLSEETIGFANRTKQALQRNKLSSTNLYFDHGTSKSVLGSDTFSNHGIVFKKSDFKIKDESAHGSMTHVYVREVLAAQNKINNGKRTKELLAPRYSQ
jgi:hypothetical protein